VLFAFGLLFLFAISQSISQNENMWKGLCLLLSVVCTLCFVGQSECYPYGASGCTYPDPNEMSPSQSGTDQFIIQIIDSVTAAAVTTYENGKLYNVTLSHNSIYLGFLLQAVKGSPGTAGQSLLGTFSSLPSDLQNAPDCSPTAASVCHTQTRHDNPRSSDAVQWTAPATGQTDITFLGVGVINVDQWYGQTNLISQTLTFASATSTTATTTAAVSTTNTPVTTAAMSTTSAKESSEGAIAMEYAIAVAFIGILTTFVLKF